MSTNLVDREYKYSLKDYLRNSKILTHEVLIVAEITEEIVFFLDEPYKYIAQ